MRVVLAVTVVNVQGSDADSNDSEDDTAELLAELNKIKKERMEETAKIVRFEPWCR